VIAHRARDQNHIADPCLAPVDAQACRRYAYAGGADEDTVTLALLHHLGVAGDDGHSGLACRRRHGLNDAFQIGQRETFFQDETGRQVQRLGPRHRHIVDRAMHREAADVAAREEQRRNNMPISSHHQLARSGQRQQRPIVPLPQVLIVKSVRKQLIHQLRRRPPASPMRHVNMPMLEINGPQIVFLRRHP